MPTTLPPVAAQLKRELRLVSIATVVLYVVVLATLVFVWFDSKSTDATLRRETVRTTNALCTFREDLARRARETQNFLAEHPEGIPGISANTLRQSVINQQQTVNALQDLDCGLKISQR